MHFEFMKGFSAEIFRFFKLGVPDPEGIFVPVATGSRSSHTGRRFLDVRPSVPVLHLHSPSFRYVVVGTKIKNNEMSTMEQITKQI